MVVLDSSFLVAWYNPRDAHHAAAARAMAPFAIGAWGQGLLLEYVFVEVVTVLRARAGHGAATEAGRRLLDARQVRWVPGVEVFVEAWTVFQAFTGAALSFADAAIVAASRRHAEGRVLTFDTDFHRLPGLTPLPEASHLR